MNKDLYSIIIPAYNEEENIKPTVVEIIQTLTQEQIPHEIVVVNDNSKDRTPLVVIELQKIYPQIKLVNRTPPGGFGRAIRSGLENFTGDIVAIVMADLSDDPKDIVKYYRKIEEGYDCVFGSRFMKGSKVIDYPFKKLYINRFVNRVIQAMFWCEHNDLTNAFKAYRSHVIKSILPLRASHFNITLEMSLSALIRQYKVAKVPINWYGRKWGSSNLRLRAMGRRYLATLMMVWLQRIFILDDLIAEKQPEKEIVKY
jgi:dolichol-phosphate mannosyltransferase